MPNYQEGKIYKIYNTVNDEIYIGSTTRKLCERMADHRKSADVKAKQHLLTYKSFREHGIEHFFIELIEKCPCNDKDELRKKEGEYIRLLKPSMNKRIEGRTPSEYYYDNNKYFSQKAKEKYKQYGENKKENEKEYISEHKKQYYENNREAIKERNKQWKETNK